MSTIPNVAFTIVLIWTECSLVLITTSLIGEVLA